MDVYSNTFCAGGAVLGNGTWAVFGGNQREFILFWVGDYITTHHPPMLRNVMQ